MSKRRNDFHRYFDLLKVSDPDPETGAVRVTGILSTETKDEDGESIAADAMRDAIPDYMKFGAVREMHDDIAAGVMLHVEVDDEGVTRCEADILDEGTIKKLQHDPPVLKGWSIGGKKLKRDPDDRKRITKIRLNECSLVDRPNNHDCLVELAKFSGGANDDTEGGEEMSLLETLKAALETDALKKAWAGEEVWDSSRACDALNTVINLLVKESAEEGEDPAQVEGLKTALEGLKAFIASEIQESTVLKASHAEDLAKAGAKFSTDTKAKLGDAHEHLQKCSDLFGKASDHLQKAHDAVKATGALDKGGLGDAGLVGKASGVDDLHKGSESEDLVKMSVLKEFGLVRTADGALENEALVKVSSLNAEVEELRKASTAKDTELEELRKASQEAAGMITDLVAIRKGAVRVVNKADDTGANTEPPPEDLTKRAPATADEAMAQARTLIARNIAGGK